MKTSLILPLALVLGAAFVAGGCSDAAEPTEDVAVDVDAQELTAAQQALADLAKAEVDAAAEEYDGEPNLLVELAPGADSRLQPLPIGDDNAAMRAALADVGASSRGAARVAGFWDSIRFRGIPSRSLFFITKKSDPSRAIGFVIHSIDRPDECSFARVSAFDLAGTRVLKTSRSYCS